MSTSAKPGEMLSLGPAATTPDEGANGTGCMVSGPGRSRNRPAWNSDPGRTHSERALFGSQLVVGWRSMAIRYLTAAAASGCGAVTRALNETGGDRIQRIDTGNAAILQLVSTMEDLGASKLDDDPPATEWIKDWRRLTEARAEFATILSDGKPHPFSIPQTDDGYPITIRMTDVAPLECERAVELASQP